MKTKLTFNFQRNLQGTRSSRRNKVMIYLQMNSRKLLTLPTSTRSTKWVCILHNLTTKRSHSVNWSSVLMGSCPGYVDHKNNTYGSLKLPVLPTFSFVWFLQQYQHMYLVCNFFNRGTKRQFLRTMGVLNFHERICQLDFGSTVLHLWFPKMAVCQILVREAKIQHPSKLS